MRFDEYELRRAMEKSPPSPCEVSKCENAKICSEELMACENFLAYVNGTIHNNRPKIPSHHLYNKIFNGTEDELEITIERNNDEVK